MQRESLKEKLARLSRQEGECLVWTGSLDAYGYGQLSVGKTKKKAHRIAWELVHGAIEDGLCVCHRCDNPKCIRIDHLFLGTQSENRADCVAKGRSSGGSTPRYGESNPNYKLTDEQRAALPGVLETMTQRQAAAFFGVSQGTISRAIGRRIVESTS